MTDGSAGFVAIEASAPQPRRMPPGHAGVSRSASVRFRKASMLSLVDEAGRIVRTHARVLVLGTGFILLPVTVLELVASRSVSDAEGGVGAVLPSLSVIAGSDTAADGYWLAGILGVIAASLLTTFIGAMSAHVVIRVRSGEAFTLWSSLAVTARRMPALSVAWLIGHSWTVLTALLIGGVPALGFLILLVGAVATIWTLYVAPVIIVEGLGPVAALKRSRRLAKSLWGQLAGFALFTGLLGLWMRGGIALLPKLAESTGLITFGGFGWLAEGVGSQIGVLIATPIVATATALSYLDTRVRREALDLVAALPETFDVR